MWQVIWRIPIRTAWAPDGIPIYGFGLMLFLAFILCTWLAGRRAEREGIKKETVQDLAIWVFIAGLLGARLTYLLQQRPLPSVGKLLVDLPRIWDGGIVLYGSVAGGLVGYFAAYFLVYRRRGLHTRRFLDAIAPAIALGLALGRMGCFLNGCCFGAVACADCAVVPVPFPLCAPCRDVLVDQGFQTVAGFTLATTPFGSGKQGVRVGLVAPGSAAYRAGLRPGAVIVGVNGQPIHTLADLERSLGSLAGWPRGQTALTLEFHPTPGEEAVERTITPWTLGLYPTQLYEVVSMLLLFLVLLAYEPFRTNPGQVCAVLMIGYGLHRYLNEILRDDPRPVGLERFGSVLLVVGGAMLWLWLWRKQPDPPATPMDDARGATPAPSPA